MLKMLSSVSVDTSPNAKCAEIFCQSPKDFTIICVFCEMKTFEFDDFLLHFKNIHFENNLLKTEELDCTPFLNIDIKNVVSKIENEIMDEGTHCVEPTALASENMVESSPEDWESAEKNTSSVADGDDWIEINHECSDYDDEDYKPKGKPIKKKYQCDQCKRNYKTEGILKHHIRKYHNDDKSGGRHLCSHCQKVLSTLRQLNSHIAKEHLGFQCTQCDKKFRANYELKRHEITHTGIKNFVCDFENCGKRFYTKRRLTAHRHIHADPKNFVCETCGYSCRNGAMLKVHYRTHTGEKPYACNLCDKRFASSSLLKEHKPIHSTERPHICDVCGATFSRPKALYHHKHLHLGIKKFKCKLCGNAFAQAAGLAGHMRQHRQSAMILYSP